MIPDYPHFAPVSLNLGEQVRNIILESKTGVSAWAFANLYLFRNKYDFNISLLKNGLLIAGAKENKTFFSILGEFPQKEILLELLKKYDYCKSVSEAQAKELNELLQSEVIIEDRDNFEYLYLRTDLANLPGKDFQKKRNLVNAFVKTYQGIEKKTLCGETVNDALHILDEWKNIKGVDGDYSSAKEALEQHETLNLSGLIVYVSGAPVAYCQGEALADKKSFAVHFEKAIDSYKGIYQYINQEFAKTLPESIIYINREQDLGNEGLRQAKMTYRPVDFVRLFSGM